MLRGGIDAQYASCHNEKTNRRTRAANLSVVVVASREKQGHTQSFQYSLFL